MRLRKLTLTNIRSYESADVSFDEGTTLFEGDIGSGKSTILLAIEFALFGLGDTDSTHLLRHGAESGEVALDFEAGGKHCQARRALKRTRTGAKSGRCVLTVDGQEEELSPSEMRVRVLGLLSFREHPNPKASSVIFRYGVYTPQEEMRAILAPGKDVREARKQTLRRAFGIEDYRTARDNLKLLEREVNGRVEVFKERSSRLDALVGQVVEARTELEGAEKAKAMKAAELGAAHVAEAEAAKRLEGLVAQEEAFGRAKDALAVRQTAWQRAKGEVDLAGERLKAAKAAASELAKLTGRIKQLSSALEGLEPMEAKAREIDHLKDAQVRVLKSQGALRARLERAEAAAAEKERLERRLEGLPDPADDIARVEREVKEADRSAAADAADVEAARRDLDALEAELASLEELKGRAECPRCHQPLTAEHLATIKEEDAKKRKALRGRMREGASKQRRDEERAAAQRKGLEPLRARAGDRASLVASIQHEAEEASKAVGARRALEALDPEGVAASLGRAEEGYDPKALEGLRRLDKERHGLEQVARKHAEEAAKEAKLERALARASEEMVGAEAGLKEATAALVDVRGRHDEAALARARAEHSRCVETRSAIASTIAGMATRLEDIERRLARMEEELGELAAAKEAGAAYAHVLAFLKDCLGPALEDVERTVMRALAEDMDASASRWFDLLVEDPDLELRVDEDFSPAVRQQEWDVDVAGLSGGERTSVAFAYRLALNGMVRRMAGPGGANLLILDEPTDGFSKEQLARMGAVLEQLEADQIVMVSHERELEDFADRVYRVVKAAGKSSVQPY